MVDRPTPPTRQFGRFLLTGLVNTGFGYGLYAGLVLLGLSPHTALAVSFSIGMLWNYTLHARLVFGRRGVSRLPAYIACYLFIYALNSAALSLAIRSGIGPLVAQALMMPVTAGLSFLLIRRVLSGRGTLRGQ